MQDGGAKEMNALQALEAKAQGGHVAGQEATLSGRLMEAARKGGAVSHAVAERFRSERGS
jgi:hypothetical protein